MSIVCNQMIKQDPFSKKKKLKNVLAKKKGSDRIISEGQERNLAKANQQKALQNENTAN